MSYVSKRRDMNVGTDRTDPRVQTISRSFVVLFIVNRTHYLPYNYFFDIKEGTLLYTLSISFVCLCARETQ